MARHTVLGIRSETHLERLVEMAQATATLAFAGEFSPREIKKMIRSMEIFKSGIENGLERLDVRFNPDDLSKAEVCARWETLDAAKKMLEAFPGEIEEGAKLVGKTTLSVDPEHL